MLEKFERDTIRPCLVRLNELNINIPLEQLQQRKDIAIMKDLLHDLDMVCIHTYIIYFLSFLYTFGIDL